LLFFFSPNHNPSPTTKRKAKLEELCIGLNPQTQTGLPAKQESQNEQGGKKKVKSKVDQGLTRRG
jgi:hypothetical protein